MNVTEEDDFQKSCVIFGTTYLIITKLPSEKLVINQFFVIVFNAIVIIPTLLLNGVAAITICKSSQLISKPCYFILLLQCTFDLVLGLLGIPLFIFFLANAVGGISNCFAVFLARRLTYASIGGIFNRISCDDNGKIHRYLTSLYLQHSSDQKEAIEVRRRQCDGGIFSFDFLLHKPMAC